MEVFYIMVLVFVFIPILLAFAFALIHHTIWFVLRVKENGIKESIKEVWGIILRDMGFY